MATKIKLEIIRLLGSIIEQESKGIRQWTINRYTYSLMINKFTPSVDKDYWLKGRYTRKEPKI